ncbi:hypothetical protein Esti_003803 [Eimeria stiedai]
MPTVTGEKASSYQKETSLTGFFQSYLRAVADKVRDLRNLSTVNLPVLCGLATNKVLFETVTTQHCQDVSQRWGCPNGLPPSFPQLLFDFAKEVIRSQPQNIYEFGKEYFNCKRMVRIKHSKTTQSAVQGTMPRDQCLLSDCSTTLNTPARMEKKWNLP